MNPEARSRLTMGQLPNGWRGAVPDIGRPYRELSEPVRKELNLIASRFADPVGYESVKVVDPMDIHANNLTLRIDSAMPRQLILAQFEAVLEFLEIGTLPKGYTGRTIAGMKPSTCIKRLSLLRRLREVEASDLTRTQAAAQGILNSDTTPAQFSREQAEAEELVAVIFRRSFLS